MENRVTQNPYPSHRLGDLTGVSLFTCDICTESLPRSKKFKTGDCSYIHHFCTDCIEKYIAVKVHDDSASTIRCPNMECTIDLNLFSCGSILPPKLFVRWCDLLCESEILAKFVDKQAYCPKCFELVLNECGGVTGETRCPGCKMWFCFQCMVPWREFHYCTRSRDEVIIRDKNDLYFMKTVARNAWSRCPTCKCYVERRSGCRTIRCRCGTKFCYDCGSTVSGHSAYGCPSLKGREMTPEELRTLKFCILFMLVCAVMLSFLFF